MVAKKYPLVLVLSIVWLVGGRSAAAESISGPMVGHTTTTSSQIWFFAPADAGPVVRWWHGDADEQTALSDTLNPTHQIDEGVVYRHRFDDLTPNTNYHYQIDLRDGTSRRGQFTTAPDGEDAGRFSYVVTSCVDVKGHPEQPAWDAVLAQAPAFHLMVGDNVYADSTEPAVLWKWHLRQRAVSNYAEVLATMPTWATWDDHDFGPNDAHGKTPGKERSLETFKHLFANPSYGTEQTPGVFHRFTWGEVDFFVLDGRYHRDDEHAGIPDGQSRKTQFGDAQLQWLFEGLRTSDATFKVIVSGYDVMGSRYPQEIKVIADLIRTSEATGVLFHAGDIHRNEFKQQMHGAGYPITQITSSGIARRPNRPWAMIDIDTAADDPTVTARFFEHEQHVATHVVKLSDLMAADR